MCLQCAVIFFAFKNITLKESLVNLTSQTCAVYFSRTVFYTRHVFTVILGICESLSSAEAFYLRVLIQGQIHVRQPAVASVEKRDRECFSNTPKYRGQIG